MFSLFAGLAAGLLHVFSGPDHLAAVAPLVLSEDPAGDSRRVRVEELAPSEDAVGDSRRVRVEGWRTGLQWGIGHTAGVLLIAMLLLILKEQLPLDAISAYSERIVGVSLIAIGFWGVWRAARGVNTSHSHGGVSFAMGTIHGLAGSSHLFGVLPALAFSVRADSILYLTGFGIGAIAGMSAFAAGVGRLSARLGRQHPFRACGTLYASSAAALVIGGFWLAGH